MEIGKIGNPFEGILTVHLIKMHRRNTKEVGELTSVAKLFGLLKLV